MPSSRPSSRQSSRTPATPAPSVDKLVVRLRSVLLNGKDPRAEMDGLTELVIKGEREILPGVSWTENVSGVYPTMQVMTVLCGNHTLEILDLSRFAEESVKDVLSWRVVRGFLDLTFEYPLNGSRRTSAEEPLFSLAPSSQPLQVNTRQRLQLTFKSHEAFSRTASTLETLGLLRPVAPIKRPHTSQSQLQLGPSRPRSGQGSRPASAQPMAPPPLWRPPSRSERSISSSSPHQGKHDGSSQLYVMPPARSQPSRARSVSHIPPPVVGGSQPAQVSQRIGPPLLTTSPYFQSRPASQAGSSKPRDGVLDRMVAPSNGNGVPSPHRFTVRKSPGQPQPQPQPLGPQSRQQGVRKSPKRVVRGTVPLPLQAAFQGRSSTPSTTGLHHQATPHKAPESLSGTNLPIGSRTATAPAESRPQDERRRAAASASAAMSSRSPAQDPLFYSSTSHLWRLYSEKYDAAIAAAGDDAEAKSRVLYEHGHGFSLAFNTLCRSASVGSSAG